MSIILPILLFAGLIYSLATMKRRDSARLREALSDVPGEMVETKLVSMGNTFRKGEPRTYRVVFRLPDGARLLHRVALHQDGSAERLL